MGKVTAVANDHNNDNGRAHADGGIQLFGNAQERADAQELDQDVVVDQDHAEEDRGKGCDMCTHSSAPPFCSSLAASIFSSDHHRRSSCARWAC